MPLLLVQFAPAEKNYSGELGQTGFERRNFVKQAFYLCRHCGNLAVMLNNSGVNPKCCGQDMERLEPERREGAGEKHAPVWTEEKGKVEVTVGAAEHPMTEEHFIEWIVLEGEKTAQYAHLKPGDAPRAIFALSEGDEAKAVYAICNQHGLWRDERCQ